MPLGRAARGVRAAAQAVSARQGTFGRLPAGAGFARLRSDGAVLAISHKQNDPACTGSL